MGIFDDGLNIDLSGVEDLVDDIGDTVDDYSEVVDAVASELDGLVGTIVTVASNIFGGWVDDFFSGGFNCIDKAYAPNDVKEKLNAFKSELANRVSNVNVYDVGQTLNELEEIHLWVAANRNGVWGYRYYQSWSTCNRKGLTTIAKSLEGLRDDLRAKINNMVSLVKSQGYEVHREVQSRVAKDNNGPYWGTGRRYQSPYTNVTFYVYTVTEPTQNTDTGSGSSGSGSSGSGIDTDGPSKPKTQTAGVGILGLAVLAWIVGGAKKFK